jgi:hypothetical protein
MVRLLLTFGVIGPPLFLVAALVEGATRAGYDPVHLPISLLALGDDGWMQTANFLVFGVLTLGFAIGLDRFLAGRPDRTRQGPLLIGVFAVGILGAGLFTADPGGGYPPGVTAGTGTGTLHDLATLVVFVALAGAAGVFSRAASRGGRSAWAAYSAASAVLVLMGFVATIVAYNAATDLTRVGGLIQRATVLVGWLWLTLLAIDALRRFARSGR